MSREDRICDVALRKIAVSIGAIAIAASAASGALAKPPLLSPRLDPVKTDINISGPFLQNRTADPHDPEASWRCGEGQITQDVRHPDTLLMSCMSVNINYQTPMSAPFFPEEGRLQPHQFHMTCYSFISRDGGQRWRQVLPEPLRGGANNMCVDPLAEHGPNGELYLGSDAMFYPADGKNGQSPASPTPWGFGGIVMTRSLDGGKTWSKIGPVPTGVNRPFWTVDQSTGVIYEVSGCSGFKTGGNYGCTGTSRNLTVSTDRGETWAPSMSIFNTEPPTRTRTQGRLHDISFPGGGYPVAAAQGVFATVGYNKPGDLPSVLLGARGAIETATFKYSTDQGATFTERAIPLAKDASTCASPSIEALAADPTRKGAFALAVVCTPTTRLRIYVTRDLGETWALTADLGVLPPPVYRRASGTELGLPTKAVPTNFDINRIWLAYGPTGKLGVLWRQHYGVVMRPEIPTPGPRGLYGPQDVFIALSADGGMNFGGTTRVNTAASPAPDPRFTGGQELSHLILDKRYAYAIWDDWRSGEMQVWFRKVPLPDR